MLPFRHSTGIQRVGKLINPAIELPKRYETPSSRNEANVRSGYSLAWWVKSSSKVIRRRIKVPWVTLVEKSWSRSVLHHYAFGILLETFTSCLDPLCLKPASFKRSAIVERGEPAVHR